MALPERIDPYDLGAIGRQREQERGVEKVRLAATHAEVRRRMQRIESVGDGINPYDLTQMAHIFEPLNALEHHRF